MPNNHIASVTLYSITSYPKKSSSSYIHSIGGGWQSASSISGSGNTKNLQEACYVK